MLTKEQIENFRITRRASPELTEDLCRLALLGLERDERAERIGRAVLVAGDTARFALDVAIAHIRNGIGFEDDEIPKLRAIADAMEDEA